MTKCKNCGFESKSNLFSFRWCPFCGNILTSKHITVAEEAKKESKSIIDELKDFLHI